MDKLDKILKEIEAEMKEIKKLPPEERLRRIAKLERMRDEELRKAELLRQESLQDIKKEEKDKEEKELSDLDSGEKEKEKQRTSTLEEEVLEESNANAARQRAKPTEESAGNLYRIVSPGDLYAGIKDIRNRAAEGRLSDEDMGRLDNYRNLVRSQESIYERRPNESESAGRSGFMSDVLRAEYALKQIEEYRTKKRQTNLHDTYQR